MNARGINRVQNLLSWVCMLLLLVSMGCQRGGSNKQQLRVLVSERAAVAAKEQKGFADLKWKIVDKHKALAENPNLVEVENSTEAGDYFSAVFQSYFSATSKLNKASMEYNAQLQAQLNAIDGRSDPKPPSFEEFNEQAMMNPNNIKGLLPWQVYAYDEKTGKVTILEDREERDRLREEAGISITDQIGEN